MFYELCLLLCLHWQFYRPSAYSSDGPSCLLECPSVSHRSCRYADKYNCSSGPCVRSDWQCDNVTDCYDGSDEVHEICSKYFVFITCDHIIVYVFSLVSIKMHTYCATFVKIANILSLNFCYFHFPRHVFSLSLWRQLLYNANANRPLDA